MEPKTNGTGASSDNNREAPRVFIIYCHQHIESGRRYIGQTSQTMEKRWKNHIYAAKSASGGRWHFPNAIRKYGPEAFSHRVLEICNTLEESNQAEEAWIDSFTTRDSQFGFNLSRGGEHKPHPIRKNPWDNPDFRARNIASNKLTRSKPEFRQRASKTSKEKWTQPEFREKVILATKKARGTPEAKAKASIIQKEVKARPEVKEKARETSRALWQSHEYRSKYEKLWKSPEFREKCQSGLMYGSSLNREKTHCRNGHEYTPENTRIGKSGSRFCRTCARINGAINMRATRARKRSSSLSQS